MFLFIYVYIYFICIFGFCQFYSTVFVFVYLYLINFCSVNSALLLNFYLFQHHVFCCAVCVYCFITRARHCIAVGNFHLFKSVEYTKNTSLPFIKHIHMIKVTRTLCLYAVSSISFGIRFENRLNSSLSRSIKSANVHIIFVSLNHTNKHCVFRHRLISKKNTNLFFFVLVLNSLFKIRSHFSTKCLSSN